MRRSLIQHARRVNVTILTRRALGLCVGCGKHSATRGTRCDPCADENKVMTETVRATKETGMVKLSSDIVRKVNKLPADKRARVDAIVRRHVKACFKQGFTPDSLERVYIEAMEMADEPEETVAADPYKYELTRRYPQYEAPRVA